MWQSSPVMAYEFGDFRSATLVSKAWAGLSSGDIEAVLAYTNKCIELYGEQARAMQKDLKDYVTGEPKDVHAKWALNDVATSLYIQGEAYRKASMKDEAKEAYQSIVDNYSFGQTWDLKGWFWKPAEAAKEKLARSITSKQLIAAGTVITEEMLCLKSPGTGLKFAVDPQLGQSGRVTLGLRPEHFSLEDAAAGAVMEARVDLVEPLGAETVIYCSRASVKWAVRVPKMLRQSIGSTIRVGVQTTQAVFFDAQTGCRLPGSRPMGISGRGC